MIPRYDETEMEDHDTRSVVIPRRKLWLIAGLAVGSAVIILVGYLIEHRGTPSDQEVRKYQAEIGRVAVLPDDETPALGTITDPSKLGHQKFFKDSRKDDKTLIYSEHNLVVLYRPSEHKIVNMGPVEITPLSPSPATTLQ